MRRLLYVALAVPMLFLSCNTDDDSQTALGSYDNGILVLNEGGLGEVSYISNDLSIVQNDIFNTVNGDMHDLGSYAQTIFFNGDRAYIISNGSNKITVVNRYSFEYIATISTGMQVPRYGAVYNGKAYITNMGDYMSDTDDFVTVINLADFSVETPIPINTRAERIIAAGGKLYVSGGSFGMGDKITIVNPDTKAIDDVLDVGVSPNSLEERSGNLYVLCGSLDQNSKLVKIDVSSNAIVDEIHFPASMANAQNLDIEGNAVYFSVGSKVYKYDLDSDQVADTPLFDVPAQSPYIGYGFAVNGGRVYISEAAADFSSSGKVFIYSTSGEYIDEITVGLGPNGFYFN